MPQLLSPATTRLLQRLALAWCGFIALMAVVHWLALDFRLAATLPRWRWLGLATGLGLGLVFGITQQLRGAHFLSHDLWTLMLCWTISTLLASWLLPPRGQPTHRSTARTLTLETLPDA